VAISAIAHITGGGITENVPRVIPDHLMATMNLSAISRSPIFDYLMKEGPITEEEMVRTFNMGIGLVIALPEDAVDKALAILNHDVKQAFFLGDVTPCKRSLRCQVTM
jgi:phosphoribosylformylglycinamidine cyclo-ligase